MRSQIEEIITHECRTYAILKCGECCDYSDLVEELFEERGAAIDASAKLAEYSEWREGLLSSFYRRVNFAQMLRSERNREVIYPMIYGRLKCQIVAQIKRNTQRTIDDELQLGRLKRSGCRSVAFKLSQDIYRGLYPQIINDSKLIPTSKILEGECRAICDSTYPLKYPDLVERLERKDNEFWAEIVDVVKNFASFLFNKGGVTSSREEEIGDFSMGCIEVLHKQAESGNLATKSSAEHLLNSIRQTCRNKLQEYFRRDSRNNSRFAVVDEREWLKMEGDININDGEMASNRYDALEELDISDIDLRNNYEVSCAVVHLLLHRDSQFYKMLVGKKEDDVDILMWHNLDKMSYEEIAIKLFGVATEKNKATIRQRCSRISDWLKTRLISIVEDYRKGADVRVAY